MKIIRDEKCFGIMMIPLLLQWGIKRCNYVNCHNEPNTIIIDEDKNKKTLIFGLCEEHYQIANKPGGATLKLEFNELNKEEL